MLTPSQMLVITRLFEHHYTIEIGKAAETYQLSNVEASVLIFLHNNPQFDTARDIVEYRFIVKSHVSKAIDLLVQKGYLSVSEDSKDRRRQHLTILPAAGETVDAVCKAQSDFMYSIHEGITEEECENLNHVLLKISHNLKQK